MTQQNDVAQKLCASIISAAQDAKTSSMLFGLELLFDEMALYQGVFHVNGKICHDDVHVDYLTFPCLNCTINNNVNNSKEISFTCIDPIEAMQDNKSQFYTISKVASMIIKAGGPSAIKAAYMIIGDKYNGNKIVSYDDKSPLESVKLNNTDMLVFPGVQFAITIPNINGYPAINKLAKEQYLEQENYANTMKRLGKHFYKDENVDECDAGGAAGATAGATAGGDIGDTAGEMAGTTIADVLGTCKPGEGYMGKDNFYIPARAKVPLHHWEAANGGSKRKKKGKYPYEKGMKVVVNMFEDDTSLNEAEGYTSYEALHGAEWEDVKATALAKAMDKADKDGIRFDKWAFENSLTGLHDRWEAAQLDPPDTATHGEINACRIDEDRYQKKDYLKNFFVHGWYDDGTMLEIGPITRGVASAYISLHKLSLNSTAFKQMKDSNFSGVKEIGHNDPSAKIPLTIVKFKDGYWLYSPDTRFKAGPFANKQLARMYAMSQHYTMEKKSPSDKAEQVERLEYPTFAFSYTMAEIPCMDIVVAEDIKRAMKLFDFQWRVYDNTRPIKQVFNTIDDLKRDLSLLRIKDIEIEELDENNIDEYVELAKETGNPSTIPQLKSRCKNPRFRYILGRNEKTGRSPIIIEW